MAQERYYNYGGTGGSDAENFIHVTLNEKGVYSGFTLSPDTAGAIEMASGAGLLPDGIIWRETDVTTIAFSPPGSTTTYTLVATHDNRSILGGVPVDYTLLEGEYSDTDLANGVVIGWVFHPGGGVPLAQEQLLDTPPRSPSDYTREYQAAAPVELVPRLARTATTILGSNLTVNEAEFDGSNFVVYQSVENSPTAVPAVQQVIQNITFFMGSYRPLDLQVRTDFASTPLTKLTLEVYDTAQAPVTVTNGVITGAGTWQDHTATVDRTGGTFDVGKPYTVRLTYDVNKGEYIHLARVLVSFWPYPTV